MNKIQAVAHFPTRTIVFKEHSRERVFDASTDELLAAACLLILRERYHNPVWGYKPRDNGLDKEEVQFLEYCETYGLDHLPYLLKRQAERMLSQLEGKQDNSDFNPDWVWYRNVQELLTLPEDEAISYKAPYRGRLVPTAYLLLMRRQNHPHEGVLILEGGSRPA